MRFSPSMAAAVVAASFASASVSRADNSPGFESGDFMVRVRGLDVATDTSSTVSVVGGNVKISNSFVPEVDASYFFTPNLSAELIAAVTYETVKDIHSAVGTLPLGSTRLLPPTATVQWHFLPQAEINPYVGAGVNYTFFYGTHGSTSPIVYSTHYSNSVGAALQLGADVHLTGNWYANIDVKKLFLKTEARLGTAAGPVKADVTIDPWLMGFGIGYKF